MDFPPIAGHGIVGNQGSCALVTLDGTVDWACLPRLDSPSVFASILDPEKGGFFSLAPAGDAVSRAQEYLEDTAVLKTTFKTPTGVLEVLDWMHMGEFSLQEREGHTLPAIYRLARCAEGRVDVRAVFAPRTDYGRETPEFTVDVHGVHAETAADRICLHTSLPMTVEGGSAAGTSALKEGEQVAFICAYGKYRRGDLPVPLQSLEQTSAYWRRWVSECDEGECKIPFRWKNEVARSCITLKILAGGRGIAAAPTTSLPEIIGGADNWDYRFSWIRDTSFTVRALASIGHLHDARKFLSWLTDLLLAGGRRPADLRVLYPLHAVSAPPEQELTHLRGYRDSKPVRIGNAASVQRQHDIYGEIVNTVFLSESLHPDDKRLEWVLRDIVDYVCEAWTEPDHGIWELRREPMHYTYSKVMCWVALDRGIQLAEKHGWDVDLDRWKTERDAITAAVNEKAWSEKRGAFCQSFDSEILDATALLIPILGFLPPEDPRVRSTVAAVEKHLTHGPHVYRSEEHRGREGAFNFCGFWLVDALALCGDAPRALERFQALLDAGNHVGLYSEEIDPETGEFLGNFPQGFTHVGLVNSAVTLTRVLTTGDTEAPMEKNPEEEPV